MPNSPMFPASLRSVLEFLGEHVGAAAQQADVRADGDERVAPGDIAANFVLVAGQDAGGLADFFKPRHRILHRLLRLGMGGIADMAERRGEVGRSDEYAVDTLDGGDR